ncbi:hypothetical protein HS5_18660 [Acidianus sp. HS-5]|nr:hypothetical protein HS5_18660 [Acidianus sp. HS-5]
MTAGIIAVIIVLISLVFGPLAPLDEPKVYAYNGEIYNLGDAVGISFSAFISLMIFIISAVILWGSKNVWYNVLIDASAISFIFLNYLNYTVIYLTWHPQMYILPFFIEIIYNGAKALQLDLGQVVLIILLYRVYKIMKMPRPLFGSEKQ